MTTGVHDLDVLFGRDRDAGPGPVAAALHLRDGDPAAAKGREAA